MRVLIAGCGYLGVALASDLIRQGHSVAGIRRSGDSLETLTNAGIEPFLADLTQPDFVRPPGHFDWVVFCASNGPHDDLDSHRALHIGGLRNLLSTFLSDPPAKWVYTGSASVYAQQDGSTVKETSSAEPKEAASKVSLEAEALLLETARKAGFPAVVLRIAETYGPDRLPLLNRFVRNEVRIRPPGTRLLNMIHRDDVVSAIVAALRSGRAGEIYNVVDQEPVTEIHFYTWLAETLGKWVPPFATAAEAATDPIGAPNRRISNRRLMMELGGRLKHPTFRQGYTAEIKALTDAGLLEIAPEQR